MQTHDWTNESETAAQLIYQWRKDDPYGELTEPATLDCIIQDELVDGAEMAVFDALVVENKRLERTAQLLGAAFNRASGSLKVVENGIQISVPMKKNGTTNVIVQFEMTDGQVVSVCFHNPDTTPAKLAPDDMLISWKWLLNRKDMTIVVAKENGKDLPLPTIARRVMALVEKNTARFAKANASKAAETELLAQLEAEKAEKIARLEKLNRLVEEKARQPENAADTKEYDEYEKAKLRISISTYNGNFLVKVPFAIKDEFKKAVKGAIWQPETKEWLVPASKKEALHAFVYGDGSSEENGVNSPIVINGDELGDFDTSTESGKKALREAAKGFLQGLRGKFIRNIALDRDVEIRQRGIKEMMRFSGNEKKLKLMSAIEQIIATAKPDGANPLRENEKKDKKPEVLNYFHMTNHASIDGEQVGFRVIFEEDANGVLHYDMILPDDKTKTTMDSATPPDNESGITEPKVAFAYSYNILNINNTQATFDDTGKWVLNLFLLDENGNEIPDEEDFSDNAQPETTQPNDRAFLQALIDGKENPADEAVIDRVLTIAEQHDNDPDWQDLIEQAAEALAQSAIADTDDLADDLAQGE
ncbi:hypothetical protein [Kingella negevensis]|uniref:defense against restriction DarA-related protein n=1 Tax=Kingella negevensis TaxID=1522312 RepID=UPI0025510EC5|nr:hypothetical protein [Kingella negevensis]MDK4680291.1 hypothetical protein [Kingella negevensis]MDK4681989.1 hypothetical protein [Kingella negevensis]MDK4690185.1 hypothetical protein [Kingella negevensis]MDK4692470.1 hypothetical protein [Kingella negevensis]MDK4698771.1 hypothetical protein [Kingella negevensis]